jgi:hypothetical protein
VRLAHGSPSQNIFAAAINTIKGEAKRGQKKDGWLAAGSPTNREECNAYIPNLDCTQVFNRFMV